MSPSQDPNTCTLRKSVKVDPMSYVWISAMSSSAYAYKVTVSCGGTVVFDREKPAQSQGKPTLLDPAIVFESNNNDQLEVEITARRGIDPSGAEQKTPLELKPIPVRGREKVVTGNQVALSNGGWVGSTCLFVEDQGRKNTDATQMLQEHNDFCLNIAWCPLDKPKA